MTKWTIEKENKTQNTLFYSHSHNYWIGKRPHSMALSLNRFKADYLTIFIWERVFRFVLSQKKKEQIAADWNDLDFSKKNVKLVERDKIDSATRDNTHIESSNKFRNAHNVAIIWLRLAFEVLTSALSILLFYSFAFCFSFFSRFCSCFLSFSFVNSATRILSVTFGNCYKYTYTHTNDCDEMFINCLPLEMYIYILSRIYNQILWRSIRKE